MELRTTAILIVCLAFSLLTPCVPTLSPNGASLRVPQDYSKIQQAIDRANPGDIVQVASGEYRERLRITKPIQLIGEGPNKTVVVGTGTVIFVNASDVEIRGFSVRNGTYGIFLWYCRNVLLKDNDMSDNHWNFAIWGEFTLDFIHDIDSSNRADGKPIHYWVDKHDMQVPNHAGYVALINCTNILVKDLTLTSNEQGVLLVSTTNSVVENITMTGNDEGIDCRWSSNNTLRKSRFYSINWRALYFQESHNNSIYENTILNGTYGLSLQNSRGNTFYHNNILHNKDQVYTDLSPNSWFSEELQEGNYWSDYVGEDLDGDGVGDTNIPWEGVDRFPLIEIRDVAPPRAWAGQDKTVFRGVATVFDAGESFDDVGISQYLWDFGDGTTAAGRTVSHTYANAGNYTVALTTVDLVGKSDTETLNVVVAEAPQFPSWWLLALGLAAGIAILISVVFWRYKFGIKKK